MVALRFLPALLLAVVAMPATAQTAYKCIGPGGRTTYQDAPCPTDTRQQAITLAEPGPIRTPSPVIAPPDAPVAAALPPATPAPPAAPLPMLYLCQKATDGSTYVSRNGDPAPYAVPFGVLGAAPQPLGSVYGTGGAGASAPELNRGNVTAGLVANNYVWVRDACRPMDVEETCESLQQQYDENEHRLRQAFKSEQGPFVKREAELEAQLANCTAR
ncbi:MAG: DUF4124 domain-containing protein [Pseudomonadota bacterium]